MFRAVREQIDTIFREDPAAKSVLEIFLCYPGFHAILLHRLSHRLYAMGIPLLPRLISQISRFFTGIEIHPGATIGRLDGWASGIREVSDFTGTYSSVGGGFALVGGVNGVHLRNQKGVTIVLQGPKAGLEVAANLSAITISMR